MHVFTQKTVMEVKSISGLKKEVLGKKNNSAIM